MAQVSSPQYRLIVAPLIVAVVTAVGARLLVGSTLWAASLAGLGAGSGLWAYFRHGPGAGDRSR